MIFKMKPTKMNNIYIPYKTETLELRWICAGIMLHPKRWNHAGIMLEKNAGIAP